MTYYSNGNGARVGDMRWNPCLRRIEAWAGKDDGWIAWDIFAALEAAGGAS